MKDSSRGRIHGREGLLRFTRLIAYAVSRPPLPWDIATIMCVSGYYFIGKAIIELAFDNTLGQRLRSIVRLFRRPFKND